MMRWRVLLAVCVLAGCFGDHRAPATHYGTDKGAGSAGVHTVLSGDTLWRVAERYQLPLQDIARRNDLRPPFILDVGQRLVLPPPRSYTVRQGDSLTVVARLFDVPVSEISRLNRLQPPYNLTPGQVLRLPGPVPPPSDAPVVASRDLAPPKKTAAPSVPPPSQAQTQIAAATPRAAPSRPEAVRIPAPPREGAKFLKPVSGRTISGYGPKAGGLYNDGINIAAPRGTPVAAAENGVVVYAGSELKGSGNLVLIRHEDRWMTAYAHLDSMSVKRGDIIRRGQQIGTVGMTGSVDAPQLHFEVRRGTQALNPEPYL